MNVSRSHRALVALLMIAALCWLRGAAQEARWEALDTRVQKLYQQGEYGEATPIAVEALRVAEATFGANDAKTATALSHLALLDEQQSKYAEAEPLFRRALNIRESALGADSPLVAQSLSNLAQLYEHQDKFAEAEPLYKRALQIDEKVLDPDNADIATLLGNLAEVYESEGHFADAEPLFQRALQIDEKALGADDPGIATDLNNLAELYDDQGRYGMEEPLLQRALAISEKAYGPQHPILAKALNNLAETFKEEGKYGDAKPLLERSLDIREKKFGHDDPEVAVALSNLAELYQDEGIYAQAESMLRRAMQIDEKALGANSTTVAVDLNNLANLYEIQGKYGAAEPLLKRSLAIREAAVGKDHPDVATVMNNLGELYTEQGRYAEAKAMLQRVLEIDEKTLDPLAPAIAAALNSMATLAEDQGNYADAAQALQLALQIDEKTLGPNTAEVAAVLSNLAGVYADEDKYSDAEPIAKRSLQVNEAVLGPNHPAVATALNTLATIDDGEGKFLESVPLYQRALHIQETVLGPDHAETLNTAANLAENYDAQGNVAEAEVLYQRVLNGLFQQFQYNFTYMTEKERLEFLDSVESYFPTYFSFVYRFHERNRQLAGAMYDLLLWEKGFVATSIASVRRQVEASGDKEAIKLLEELSVKRTQLAALLNTQPPDRDLWRKQIDQLRTEADDIEKALVARSAAFAEKKRMDRATWEQVRDALKPGEAAVEFARFRYFDKQWTDKSYYVALVVTSETKREPEFILLGDAQQIDGNALMGFRRAVQTRGVSPEEKTKVPSARAYELIWQPLEEVLNGKSRIFVAPDGALNEIPLGIIPAPDGKLQMERYDLRLVSSTKEILLSGHAPASTGALLVGDPAFDASDQQQATAMQALKLPRLQPQSVVVDFAIAKDGESMAEDHALPPLPGTGAEIVAISDLMKAHGWMTAVYTRDSALKSVVERAGSARVVHIATHGFFLLDQEIKPGKKGAAAEQSVEFEDPMLRSGLYFSGADRTLAGTAAPNGLDNGVLTALEASNLDLRGTELVALSACNTGQGDIKNGEGVFGLRRALQEAGAQAVLMSLWSVPDHETQDLMKRFYAKWLGGMDKHEALKEAQLEVREEVRRDHDGRDLPFYWGAFVLYGN